jgi:hypothetical protein
MDWHPLLSLILTDFFTDSPISVALEKELRPLGEETAPLGKLDQDNRITAAGIDRRFSSNFSAANCRAGIGRYGTCGH